MRAFALDVEDGLLGARHCLLLVTVFLCSLDLSSTIDVRTTRTIVEPLLRHPSSLTNKQRNSAVTIEFNLTGIDKKNRTAVRIIYIETRRKIIELLNRRKTSITLPGYSTSTAVNTTTVSTASAFSSSSTITTAAATTTSTSASTSTTHAPTTTATTFTTSATHTSTSASTSTTQAPTTTATTFTTSATHTSTSASTYTPYAPTTTATTSTTSIAHTSIPTTAATSSITSASTTPATTAEALTTTPTTPTGVTTKPCCVPPVQRKRRKRSTGGNNGTFTEDDLLFMDEDPRFDENGNLRIFILLVKEGFGDLGFTSGVLKAALQTSVNVYKGLPKELSPVETPQLDLNVWLPTLLASCAFLLVFIFIFVRCWKTTRNKKTGDEWNGNDELFL